MHWASGASEQRKRNETRTQTGAEEEEEMEMQMQGGSRQTSVSRSCTNSKHVGSVEPLHTRKRDAVPGSKLMCEQRPTVQAQQPGGHSPRPTSGTGKQSYTCHLKHLKLSHFGLIRPPSRPLPAALAQQDPILQEGRCSGPLWDGGREGGRAGVHPKARLLSTGQRDLLLLEQEALWDRPPAPLASPSTGGPR